MAVSLDGQPTSSEETAYCRHGKQRHLVSKIRDNCAQQLRRACGFAKSKTGRRVFKCSLAYLLGSMATFVPWISKTLGHQDGKHMVATVTVYYHPARSIGGMMEAFFCASGAFAYAVCISFSSMAVSVFFAKSLDMIVLGHIIVLLLFCGAGLGFVGWVKQRMSHPLVNISCSLTSLAIITVITKEGAVQAAEFSDDKVTQVMLMILMGICATTAVSLLVFPEFACHDLRDNSQDVFNACESFLTSVSSAFLSNNEQCLESDEFRDARQAMTGMFTKLTKNLEEAKFENTITGFRQDLPMQTKLISSLQRIAQTLGGLESAARTRFLLQRQEIKFSEETSLRDRSHVIQSAQPELERLIPEESRDEATRPTKPGSMIDVLLFGLRPCIENLSSILQNTFKHTSLDPHDHNTDLPKLSQQLRHAIQHFCAHREQSFAKFYQNKHVHADRRVEVVADWEEAAASCGYFCFLLLDLAEEMEACLALLDEYRALPRLGLVARIVKSTGAMNFWRPKTRSLSDAENMPLIDANAETEIPGDVKATTLKRKRTTEEDKQNEYVQCLRYRVWKRLGFFRRDDVKFAIKVGGGAALYALPSFLASTRPFYQGWRGEWGLLSYMLVCAMTLGASNTTGFARALGTCIGAVCAILSWTASRGNVYVLAFFGWLMSLWTSYIIVAQGKGPMGRFIMLTYNLSALYAYSLSAAEAPGDEDEGGLNPIISEIVLHRVLAVLSGCLWGLIVTRLVWPISAAEKLKDGLSILWIRMGLLWKHDPLAQLSTGRPAEPYYDMHETLGLRRFLARIDKLQAAAASEMHLRRSFPSATYARIVQITGKMLDAFHAMHIIITKNRRATHGELKILQYTAEERTALCKRINHLYQVLASSMKLEFPLREALPSIQHTRDNLLVKMFNFREQEGTVSCEADEEDYELHYTFALVTAQLDAGIRALEGELEGLFGILNEDLLRLQ